MCLQEIGNFCVDVYLFGQNQDVKFILRRTLKTHFLGCLQRVMIAVLVYKHKVIWKFYPWRGQ